MGVGVKGKNEVREGGRELSKEVSESRKGFMEGTRREGGRGGKGERDSEGGGVGEKDRVREGWMSQN